MDKHLNKQQLDDIVKAIDSVPAFKVTQEISDFALHKVLNVLSSQGFKRPDSVKAREFIEKKPLVYDLKDGKFLAIYVIYNPDMNAMYRQFIAAKTKSGTVYVENTEDKKHGFMSHLFDRFATRTGECTLIQRNKAIRRYLQTDELSPDGKIVACLDVDADTKKILSLHPLGVCLGVEYKEYVIHKTFILYSMMSGKQKKVVEMIKQWNIVRQKYLNLLYKQSKGTLFNDEKEELKLITDLLKENTPVEESFNEFNEELIIT